MEKKNQPCYDKNGNFLGWFSRSVAVVVFIFRKKGNKLQIAIEKRGKGCPDNVGKWCTVCGYLEFNDTLEDSCIREAKEELNFDIIKNRLQFIGINSHPTENLQNVSVHYIYFADSNDDFDYTKATGGEKDEVEKAEWFNIGTFNNDNVLSINIIGLKEREFAFNHDKMIIKYLSDMYNVKYNNDEQEKEENDAG